MKKSSQMAKGKASKKSAGVAKKGGKRGNRKPKRSWSVYIYRALRQVNKSLTVSGKAMSVVNSFVSDMFDRLASEAASLARSEQEAYPWVARSANSCAACAAC